MKFPWTKRCLLLVFCFWCSWQLSAANADTIDPGIQPALAKMMRAYESAVSSGSLEEIKPLLSKGFSAVTLLGDEVSSVEQLKASNDRMLERLGGLGSYHVEVVPDLVQQISPELVLLSGVTNDRLVSSVGNTFEFRTTWTAFGIKEDGAWKLRRVHTAVMHPFDNSFVHFIAKGAKITYGVLAGLLGVLLGGTLTALLIGRRTSAKHDA